MNSAAQTRVKLEIVIRNSSLETQPIVVVVFFFYRFNNLPLIISVDKAKNRNTVCVSVGAFFLHPFFKAFSTLLFPYALQ